MDSQAVSRFKRILIEEKRRLAQQTQQLSRKEVCQPPDSLADETDLAVSELQQHLTFKLRKRETDMLQKINSALARIDAGTFGSCDECEEPIEMRRLEARPVCNLCLSCKEKEEHREKIYA